MKASPQSAIGASEEELELHELESVTSPGMPEMDPTHDETAADVPLIRGRGEGSHGDAFPLHEKSSGNAFVWALTVSACASSALFGYDSGVISGTLVSIGTDLSSRELTNLDKGLITSCTSFFALVASPIAGVLADRVGRKDVILFADGLFTLGALWQAFTSSVLGMIIGRSIVGLAIGAASLIVPLYISELAPGHLRGRLVTVSLLFITGGQVIAYVVGWIFSAIPGGWRWMVGLGSVPAIAQLLMLTFMPETPRYLAKVEKEAEARSVLTKVYRGMVPDTTDIVDDILLAIKKEIQEEEEAHAQLKISEARSPFMPPTLHALLFHPPHVRALVITCSLQGLQQLCGFNSLMYFSATIFQRLHFSSPTLVSLTVAGTNFLFTLAAFGLIDRIGRRRILLITIPLMVLSLLLCALAFSYIPKAPGDQFTVPTSNEDSTTGSRLPAFGILVSMLLYVSTYAVGLGPVPWQQSEMFPLSVRSLGSSIATATNWGSNTVVGLTFLPMMDLLTPKWTFVTYAAICAAGWVVIYHIYPETMGLGLEEVGELLKHGWGVKESMERVRALKMNRADRH
ncbi:Myo-inositol transporter 1 [Exophiala dermatitidis]